jgi:threonine synthase
LEFADSLRCVFCGRTCAIGAAQTCSRLGPEGILDVQYDHPSLARVLSRRTLGRRVERSHWRYRELLPVRADSPLPALAVGWTPPTPAPRLGRHIGVPGLLLKDEGRNSTGSLKDRASALAVVKAREGRRKIVSCASTGNAASSCAGMAASLGLHSVIFVPERTPEPKLAQLLVFGATVLRVGGSYEEAYRLS